MFFPDKADLHKKMGPVLCVALVLVLAGCGAEKSTSDSASRGTDGTVTNPGYKLAECSKLQGVNTGLRGYVSTYYSMGRMIPDKINLSLTNVPPDLTTNANYVAQFFRWSERKAGQKVTNSIPTKFMLIDRLTGNAIPQTTAMDRLTKSAIDTAITNLKASTVTASNFFERAMLVLQDVGLEYDAIHITSWDLSQGTAASKHDDFLLPAFFANPSAYAMYIPSLNLQRLHPFYAWIGSGGSEADFSRQAEDLCAEMIQASSRIPASMSKPTLAPESEAPGLFKRIWDGFLELFQ